VAPDGAGEVARPAGIRRQVTLWLQPGCEHGPRQVVRQSPLRPLTDVSRVTWPAGQVPRTGWPDNRFTRA